jgi:mannose-6-phosphate isomerase-like protein (cupin superfamily)
MNIVRYEDVDIADTPHGVDVRKLFESPKGIVHTVSNAGDEPLRFLVVKTPAPGNRKSE